MHRPCTDRAPTVSRPGPVSVAARSLQTPTGDPSADVSQVTTANDTRLVCGVHTRCWSHVRPKHKITFPVLLKGAPFRVSSPPGEMVDGRATRRRNTRRPTQGNFSGTMQGPPRSGSPWTKFEDPFQTSSPLIFRGLGGRAHAARRAPNLVSWWAGTALGAASSSPLRTPRNVG